MTTASQKRMLGGVELAVHGSSARRPELTEALKQAIARSETLQGKLLIGYPHKTDAVLITPNGTVIAIVLHENADEDTCQRQDAAFNSVYSRLQRNENLRKGRELAVDIQTLGVHAGIREPRPDDREHPLVHIGQAAGKLEQFAAEPRRSADAELVLAGMVRQNTND